MENDTLYSLVRAWAGAGGLVFMVILFVGIVAYALWPGNKKKFDHLAQLPLQDDDKPKAPETAEDGKRKSTETGQ